MTDQAQANAQALADEYKALVDTYRAGAAVRDTRIAELEAHNARMRAAIERYLALSSDCEYIDGEPDACPAPDGAPCHWCELRAAVSP